MQWRQRRDLETDQRLPPQGREGGEERASIRFWEDTSEEVEEGAREAGNTMTDHTITLTAQELAAPFKIAPPDSEPLKGPTRLPILSEGSSWKYVRYVRHHEVEAYLAKGWVVSNDMRDTHHGRYATLMVWCGMGEPG
jgi:hypothetical protein